MARFPRLRVPPAHELLRLGDQKDPLFSLREHHLRGALYPSYRPSRRLVPIAIPRIESLSWLERQCDTLRPPVNRRPNKEMVRGLWKLGEMTSWVCHPKVRLSFQFRRDLTARLQSDALVVSAGKAYSFWIQVRASAAAPTMHQLGLLARLFLLAANRADQNELGFVIADMRNRDADARAPIVYMLDDLPVASEAALERTLQRFADAHYQLLAEGFDPDAERSAKREKAKRPRHDGPQPDLFP